MGDLKLNDILPLLKNVRKNAADYIALCPSHDDQQQSLSIKEVEGKILLKCFAGCDAQAIVSALGIELKDLFTDQKQSKAANNFQSKKIIAVYDYADETGDILYQNVRYEPKDFRQRKPNGVGGYNYSLNGARRVPYRLPELVEAVPDVFRAARIGLGKQQNRGRNSGIRLENARRHRNNRVELLVFNQHFPQRFMRRA